MAAYGCIWTKNQGDYRCLPSSPVQGALGPVGGNAGNGALPSRCFSSFASYPHPLSNDRPYLITNPSIGPQPPLQSDSKKKLVPLIAFLNSQLHIFFGNASNAINQRPGSSTSASPLPKITLRTSH